jgi:hypothetical protein
VRNCDNTSNKGRPFVCHWCRGVRPVRPPNPENIDLELCNFLPSDDRKILLEVIYECIGIDVRGPRDKVDFEELLDRLDPRALSYLTTDKSKEIRPRAAEIALQPSGNS